MHNNIKTLIHNSGLFDNEEKAEISALFRIVLQRKKDPFFPSYLPQAAAACLNLETLALHNKFIQYPQGLNILIRASHSHPDIISRSKPRSDISADEYPTFKMVVNLADGRSLFYKLLTRLLVWDWILNLNFQPASKSKLVTSIFNHADIQDFTNEATQFIEDSGLDLDKDFLMLTAKLKNWCSRHQNTDTERYAADFLKKFINKLFQQYHSSEHHLSNTKRLPSIDEVDDESFNIDLLSFTKPRNGTPLQQGEHANADKQEFEPPDHQFFPPEVKTKTSRYQNGYAKIARYRTIQQAQHLDNANQILTEAESQHFFEQILADQSEVATQAMIVFALGAEPLFWDRVSLEDFASEYWIDIKSGLWASAVNIGNKHVKPDTEISYLFEKTITHFIKPLPRELTERLTKLDNSNALTLKELFSNSATEISDSVDNWIKNHNPFGRSISLAKIRNHLYHQILRQQFDEAAANHIIAQRIHKEPQSLAYTAFPRNDLIDIYKSALPQLSFTERKNGDDFIGSMALFKEVELSELFREVSTHCVSKKNQLVSSNQVEPNQLIEFHNSFVSYIALFGMLITSHRPTHDPFARLIDFALEINAVFLSDKIVDEKHLMRIAFYDDQFKNQINQYIEHLTVLDHFFGSNTNSEDKSPITQIFDPRNESVPFLFFLSQEEKGISIIPISPSSLRPQLVSINPVWEKVPLNFGRHYLSSKLRKLGINPEYINYQLGHVSAGEEPYGSHSVLSPKIVSKILNPALGQITKSLKLIAITGLEDIADKFLTKTVQTLLPYKRLLAPLKRIEKYQNTIQNEKAIARETYNSMIRPLDKDFDNETFQIIAQEAIETIIAQSHLRAFENLQFITARIKVKARQNGCSFESPLSLMKMDIETSVFSYRQVAIWQNLKKAKHIFYSHLLEINFNSIPDPQLVALFFISIQLHTRLIDRNRLALLYDALTKRNFYFYKDRVYFELETRKNQIQRVALDLTSSLILNRILDIKPIKRTFSALESTIKKTIKAVLSINPEDFLSGIEFDAGINMPALLSAVQTGQRKTASVPKNSMIRIRTQNRLKKSEPAQETLALASADMINLSTNLMGLNNEFNLKKQLKHLRSFSNPLTKKLSRKELTARLEGLFESEVKPNPDIAEITKLICIWLIFRINAPGMRKKDLAFVTIYGYLHSFAPLLIEHIGANSIADYDNEALRDIYNQIIQAQSTENQSTTARQLYLFHQLIGVELYRLDPIEIDGFEYESSDSEPRIKASLIMPWEVERCHNLIEGSQGQEFIKSQSHNILELYSRFGFRPSELMDIETADVKDNYISIRWNRLGRLKNTQSFRSVLFNEKWSDANKKLMKDSFSIHSASKQITFNRFWVSKLDSEIQDKKLYLSVLNQTLKAATGEETSDIYSLRHSLATLEILGFLANTLDFEMVEHDLDQQFMLEHYYPKGFKNFINKVFTNPLPSRRHIYRTGRSLGHQTARTSLTNYSHFYEWVTPYYFSERVEDLSNRLLVHLTGKTENAIKGLRKREKNPRRLAKQLLLQLAREQKKFDNLNAIEAAITTSRKIPPLNLMFNKSTLTPELLYQGLVYLKETTSPDFQVLSTRYLLNPDCILRIEKKYNELFLQTGYDPMGFGCQLDKSLDLMGGNNARNLLIPKLRDDFHLLRRNIDTRLLELWARYYHPKHKFWHFETLAQIQEMITMLSLIDIPQQQIFLGTHKKHKNDIDSLVENVKFRYAKDAMAKPIARILNPSLSPEMPGLIVSNTGNTRFLNEELNLIFFINLIFLEIANC